MFLLAAPADLSSVVRIPVAYDGGDGEVEQSVPDVLGDFGVRTPSGTAVATRRGTALREQVRTRPLSLTEAPAIRAVLEDPAGIYVAGEWLELVTGCYLMPAHIGEVKQRHVSLASGRHVVLSFEVIQAGPIDCDPPETPSAWWRARLDRYEDLAGTIPANDNADRIARWDEQEAGAFSLLQPSGTPADLPLYRPAGFGAGLPGVDFNARPWMVCDAAALLALVSGTDVPWSAILVVRIPAGTLQEGYVLAWRDGSGLSGAMHAIGVTVVGSDLFWNTIRMGDSGGSTSATSFAPIDTSEDRTFVLLYMFDGPDGARMLANGELVLEDALSVGAFNPTALVVGALDDGGAFEWPAGVVGEVVVFGGSAIAPLTQMTFAGAFQPYLVA